MNTSLPAQVWTQAVGRLLYQLGSAVLIFYTPIIFVNYGSLSATMVGFAVGGGSVAGFFGNLLGGGMTDSRRFGRKRTLLVSAGLAIATAFVTLLAHSFALLLAANVLFGISVGLYWTAADAAVMDATEPEQRQQAFSILSVMDNVGFGIGTWGGGVLLKLLHPVNLLFGVGAIAFLIFAGLVAIAMQETRSTEPCPESSPDPVKTDWKIAFAGWKTALLDGRLMTYLWVNVLFITFMALVNNTLPLYFINFGGTSEAQISNLFTWAYIGLGALVQVPLVRLIGGLSYLRSLMISMGVWGAGFLLVWGLGGGAVTVGWVFGVFGVFAIATSLYKPTSSAWIAEIAPESLRGVYTAIAYQCWSIGYVIGPILGGWALDQPAATTQVFWLAIAVSTVLGGLILQTLDQKNRRLASTSEQLAEEKP